MFGSTSGNLENAMSPTEVTIKTGNSLKPVKGSLITNTGWRRSTGADTIVDLNFYWAFEPASDGAYKPFESKFLFLFAQDKHADWVNAAQFTRKRMTADITAHTYSYSGLTRSIYDFDQAGHQLTQEQTSALSDPDKKFSFFWDASGMLTANDKINDVYAWRIDFDHSSYDNKNGRQEMMMSR